MSPWLFAFIIIGPACFIAGFLVRPIFAGKSSSPSIDPQTLREIVMAVFAELQQPLADLDAAVQALPAKVAAAVSAGDPQAAQDRADTIAAVTASAANAVTAIGAIGAPAGP